MNVLVLGASGKTGGLVVDAALAKGYTVTVLVRDPAKFTKPGVLVLTGDATRAEDVMRAMKGQQAVIDSIGGTTPYKARRSRVRPRRMSSMRCVPKEFAGSW